MSAVFLGCVYVSLSAFLFGLVAVITKYAYGLGLTAKQLVLVQGLFSSFVLWSVISIFCPERKKISTREIKYLIVQGCLGSGLSTILFFYALLYLPASLASVLFFTYPIIVIVLTIIFLGEKTTAIRWISLLCAFLGSIFALGLGRNSELQISGLGIGIALGAAFFNALLNIFAQRNLKHNHPLTVTFYAVLFSNLNYLVFAWPPGPKLSVMTGTMWLTALLLSLLSTIFPLLLYFNGVRLIGVGRASIISTIELPFTIFLAKLVLREEIGLSQTVGTGLILAAVLLLQNEEKVLEFWKCNFKVEKSKNYKISKR